MSLFTGKVIIAVTKNVEDRTKDVILHTVNEYSQEEARQALATWLSSNSGLFTTEGKHALRYEITSKLVLFSADINESLDSVKI